MKRLIIAVALIVVVVVVTAIVWMTRSSARVEFQTVYQAVLLDNGQVYYGRIQGAETEFPVLTDVYYVQNQVNPQTKEVTNILVRRGKEWHAPDRMILNARHIVLIEPVSPESKVAHLIAENQRSEIRNGLR